MKHEINITYSGYKYAPESFTFYVNGKVYAPRHSQAAHNLAMLIIQGKEKEARDEIKRDIRRSYKEPEYITIGFFEEGNTGRYFFTRQLRARRDDLKQKLYIYKEWKHYIESKNCILNTYEVKAGEFIPGKPAATHTQVIEEKADLKRPVIIKLI